MSKPKIAVIISSTRPTRFGDKPATWIAEHAAKRGDIDVEIVDLRDYDLPLFDAPASDAWMPTPNPVAAKWQAKLNEFDGFIIVTAEYNRSITGALKNAIDVGSRPYGKSAWSGKPGAVISVSPGAIGGFGANHHLRQSLVFLNVPCMQQPEAYLGGAGSFFEEAGMLGDGMR